MASSWPLFVLSHVLHVNDLGIKRTNLTAQHPNRKCATCIQNNSSKIQQILVKRICSKSCLDLVWTELPAERLAALWQQLVLCLSYCYAPALH